MTPDMDPCRSQRQGVPAGQVDVDNAGLQQLPVQVGAGRQEPALVMGQAVPDKEHVVFLTGLSKCLSQLCLLVFDGRQDERR